MTMHEFQERVADAMRASGRERVRFISRITVVFLATVMLAACGVVLLGGGSAVLALVCAGRPVGMLILMLHFGREGDCVQRRLHVKTPCSGQGISQLDQKIIMASATARTVEIRSSVTMMGQRAQCRERAGQRGLCMTLAQ